MFQRYVHPAAIDSNLPCVSDLAPDDILFSYSSGVPGSSFVATVEPESQFSVHNLVGVPRNSLLAVNLGCTGVPGGLTGCTVVFLNLGNQVIGEFPIHGTGLGQHADAVMIPHDAVSVAVKVAGFSRVAGQVRVVAHEVIPYQPLKG